MSRLAIAASPIEQLRLVRQAGGQVGGVGGARRAFDGFAPHRLGPNK